MLAIVRFDQFEGVSDSDRDLAFANILKAARHYKVQVKEDDWHELGNKTHTKHMDHSS